MNCYKIIILLVSLVCTHSIAGQGCLPEGILFNSQAQVDTFKDKYPKCIRVEGSVTIKSNAITNLSGLDELQIVDGDLTIDSNELLVDLDGMESLTKVGGALKLRHNKSLKNLNGFASLFTVGSDLVIAYHPFLDNIKGLGTLDNIDGDLTIIHNDSLKSLEGLEVLDEYTINNLFIYQNPILSMCMVKAICDYVELPSAEATIYNNAEGCNSVNEVAENCAFLTEGYIHEVTSLIIYPNPAYDFLNLIANGNHTPNTVNVYDITGKIVFTEKQPADRINISGLQKGVYFLEFIVDQEKIRRKFMVR